MKNSIGIFVLIVLLIASCEYKRTIIKGNWVSTKAESLGNGTFGKRQFSIDDTNWEVNFTLYLDSTFNNPVFTFRAKGTYELKGKSQKVEGATEAIFGFTNKYVTLHTADTTLSKNFRFSNCGLEPNQEKEITATGCSFLESKDACSQEFDIAMIKDEKLYLGARPASGKNLCSEKSRPTSFGLPLVRLESKK